MSDPIELEQAKELLRTEAVGLGEDHSKATAREAIYVLMKQTSLVKHLVLELGAPWESRGAWGSQYRSVVAKLDAKWGNPFTLAKLIQCAALKGVHIHCWDPGDKPGLTMGENASRRNREVSEQFEECFNVGRRVPGCILLFGSKHFNFDEHSLDSIIAELAWVNLSH